MFCLPVSCLLLRAASAPRAILREQHLARDVSSRDIVVLQSSHSCGKRLASPCTASNNHPARSPTPGFQPCHARNRVPGPGWPLCGLDYCTCSCDTPRPRSSQRKPDPDVRPTSPIGRHAIPDGARYFVHSLEAPRHAGPHEIWPAGRELTLPISDGHLQLGTCKHLFGEHRSDGGRRSVVATLWGELMPEKSDTTADSFTGVYLRWPRRGRLTW